MKTPEINTRARRNFGALVAQFDIPTGDFYTLTSSEVARVIEAADFVRYRQPRDANGSRGRYFHARLMRDLRANG